MWSTRGSQSSHNGHIRTWSPASSHPEYSCFKGLFTIKCSSCHVGYLSKYVHKVSIHCINYRSGISVKWSLMYPVQASLASSRILLVSCSWQLVTSPSVRWPIHPVWHAIIGSIGMVFLYLMSHMVVASCCLQILSTF
jgi:hypothetical protein